MVQHFANLPLSCLRGQPQGLITDLPGQFLPTARHIIEGWPVTITGSTHAPLKLIKTQADGCYLQHGPCA